MNSNRSLTFLKRGVAVLLMCCFFMPLSKCTGKAEAHGKTVTEDSYIYPYEVVKSSAAEVIRGKVSGAFTLIAAVGTFFLPLVCLGLAVRAQASVCVISSFVAQYWLYLTTYLYQGIQIGGALAIGCWAFILVLGCVDILRSRHGFVR
ncbi:MAG TPA: hypothetical protein VF472_23950 [Burkholderiaceae bacterium]